MYNLCMSQPPKHGVTLKNNPIINFTEKYLYPIDSLSETFFSILIVLMFTLAYRIFSISSATSSIEPINSSSKILIAILGAVIAWGFIDGVIYAVLSIFEREEQGRFLRDVSTAQSEQERIDTIEEEFEDIFEPITDADQRDLLYHAISKALKPTHDKKIGLKKEDVMAGLAHIFVALSAVIPSLIPFVLFNNNPILAIRVSNLVSFVMLFITGYRWGKYTQVNPLRTGLIIMSVAIVLALFAIPLGG